MSRTVAQHERFEILYISQPSSAKQQPDIIKICVVWERKLRWKIISSSTDLELNRLDVYTHYAERVSACSHLRNCNQKWNFISFNQRLSRLFRPNSSWILIQRQVSNSFELSVTTVNSASIPCFLRSAHCSNTIPHEKSLQTSNCPCP